MVVGRFARSNRVFWRIYALLTNLNPNIESKTTDGVLDGPNGKLMLSLLLSLAKAEFELFKKHIRDSKITKANKHKFVERRPAFGYKVAPYSESSTRWIDA